MANGERLSYTDALREVRGGLTALGDKLGTVGENVAILTERSQNTNRRLDSIEEKIDTIWAAREKDRETVEKLANRVHDIEGGDRRKVAWIAGIAAILGGGITALGNVIAKLIEQMAHA